MQSVGVLRVCNGPEIQSAERPTAPSTMASVAYDHLTKTSLGECGYKNEKIAYLLFPSVPVCLS